VARYAALLRGINVGGNNIIRMTDLKECFEAMGLRNVATYIQSGNVAFDASESHPARLALRIEKALGRAFGYEGRAVVRSHAELAEVVALAPRGFGRDSGTRYNVLFLIEPVTPSQVLKEVAVRDGVDRAAAGPGVLYFATLKSAATRSGLQRIIGSPVYQSMTIRNWNTTVKLEELTRSA
jgi:uncharacterized protein (DUF1697 family)